MAEICTQCFSDMALREAVRYEGEIGECEFCRTEGNIVVDTSKLFDLFDSTTDCLSEDDDGMSPVEIYASEFNLFSECLTKPEDFLAEVFDRDFLSKRYSLPAEVTGQSQSWKRFKDELKYGNRYFPQFKEYEGLFSIPSSDNDFDVFGELVTQVKKSYRAGDKFYRARISDCALSVAEMGRPPREVASNGRANPVGISYLYVSEGEGTSVKEVRPSIGSKVWISELQVTEDFRVIDLTSPRTATSILAFQGERMLPALKYLKLLESFSQDLSNPIVPERSKLEYVPTQFVCEFLKTVTNFAGIRYASSYGECANLVLFDEDKVLVREPMACVVTGSNIDYRLEN